MQDGECPIEGGYVPIPRNLVRDCRNGRISQPERNLLVWLRMTADKMGVTHCSMADLSVEAFNDKVSISYINKLLRSLKGKRWVWYEDRPGRRGVFELHHRDWMLKGNKIKELDELFEDEEGWGATVARWVDQSEVDEEKAAESQRIELSKEAIRQTVYGPSYKD